MLKLRQQLCTSVMSGTAFFGTNPLLFNQSPLVGRSHTWLCQTHRCIHYRDNNNNSKSPSSGDHKNHQNNNNNYGRSSHPSNNYSRNKSFEGGKQQVQNHKENRFDKFNQKSSSRRDEEFKPKFKSTVIPFEKYKKQSKSSTTDNVEKSPRNSSAGYFRKQSEQPSSPPPFNKFNKNNQQQDKFRKERFSSKRLFDKDDKEITQLFEENKPTHNKNRGREGNRFRSSVENQVDSYIKGNEQKHQQQGIKPNKKMPYIPVNEHVRNMINQENNQDDLQDDFQDLTKVKKIDLKRVDKDVKKKNQTKQREIKDPMSDELKWIDEDEYRSIHQKGMKKMINSKNDSITKGATAHILSQSRKSPNVPNNVTFVMDSSSKGLARKEEEIDDDEDVIFYGDEDYEDDDDFDFEEDLEEEEEQHSRKGSKKVKKEQEEAPKIDILPDAMVGKYLKQIQKDKMSKNREFKSLPVVNGIIKEVFSCGLVSKRSLKQAEYLQYFTSDEVSKTDEEAKSRNAMANMLSGNKVIEAQLKRQQVARKTNKTSLVYNQPELRADMQVKDDVVNWVFKNYKMKYIGSIGLSKEDELLLLKEQEQENIESGNEKRLSIENLTKEELNEMLEREENLYEFYRRNYEEDDEVEVEEEKEKEEDDEDSETLVRKLYDVSKILEKCKGIPQVAFAGRSNVGKSSLINAITGRNNLKASEKPGQTKDLNFHRFGKHFCLVDMPGYGFAFTKDSLVTLKWLELIRKYFVQSSTDLKVVFLLIDSRLGLKRKDLEMISFLEENNVPYQIVFTKCDLMYVDDLARMAFKAFKIDPLTKGVTFKNHIKDEETGDFRMIFVSSRSKTGVARLKEDIVLKHSNFDVESWKKNVKKNFVMFV